MSDEERVGAQVIDLQARIAYQEDTLLKLDAAITEQAGRIRRLEAALEGLRERLESALDPDDAPSADVVPPHY